MAGRSAPKPLPGPEKLAPTLGVIFNRPDESSHINFHKSNTHNLIDKIHDSDVGLDLQIAWPGGKSNGRLLPTGSKVCFWFRWQFAVGRDYPDGAGGRNEPCPRHRSARPKWQGGSGRPSHQPKSIQAACQPKMRRGQWGEMPPGRPQNWRKLTKNRKTLVKYCVITFKLL